MESSNYGLVQNTDLQQVVLYPQRPSGRSAQHPYQALHTASSPTLYTSAQVHVLRKPFRTPHAGGLHAAPAWAACCPSPGCPSGLPGGRWTGPSGSKGGVPWFFLHKSPSQTQPAPLTPGPSLRSAVWGCSRFLGAQPPATADPPPQLTHCVATQVRTAHLGPTWGICLSAPQTQNTRLSPCGAGAELHTSPHAFLATLLSVTLGSSVHAKVHCQGAGGPKGFPDLSSKCRHSLCSGQT